MEPLFIVKRSDQFFNYKIGWVDRIDDATWLTETQARTLAQVFQDLDAKIHIHRDTTLIIRYTPAVLTEIKLQ